MAAINVALASCSTEHPVFHEDEVDIHLNPKIRADWQLCGLWQALHETITRNHQCRSVWQLLKKIHFMGTVSRFPGGKHGLAKV